MVARTHPAPETETRTETKRVLICARCEHEITTPDAAIEKNGAHRHARINPFGFVHEFGCFQEAPGARPVGEPTEEATWFAGHAWRIAECGSCGEHLGWRWDGPTTFFGLLLDRVK